MYGIDVSDKNAVYGALSDGAITITDVRAGPASTTRIQLHDKKVAHLHLNPGHPHLLATSSHDNTVAVWDVRKMSGGKKGKADPLSRLAHGKGVNAAYWSPITGNHLLSTCNDDRLRCYEDIVAKLGTIILSIVLQARVTAATAPHPPHVSSFPGSWPSALDTTPMHPDHTHALKGRSLPWSLFRCVLLLRCRGPCSAPQSIVLIEFWLKCFFWAP